MDPSILTGLRRRTGESFEYEVTGATSGTIWGDGVYTDDPRSNPAAEFIPEISHMDALQRGLKVMDSTALSLCNDNHLPIYVFNMDDASNIERIVSGERVGTLVHS